MKIRTTRPLFAKQSKSDLVRALFLHVSTSIALGPRSHRRTRCVKETHGLAMNNADYAPTFFNRSFAKRSKSHLARALFLDVSTSIAFMPQKSLQNQMSWSPRSTHRTLSHHILEVLQIASLVLRDVSNTNDRLECPKTEHEYPTPDE